MAPKVPFLGLETETLHLINSMTLTDFGLICVAASMLVQYLSWSQRCDSRKVVLPATTTPLARGPLTNKRITKDVAIAARAGVRSGADRL